MASAASCRVEGFAGDSVEKARARCILSLLEIIWENKLNTCATENNRQCARASVSVLRVLTQCVRSVVPFLYKFANFQIMAGWNTAADQVNSAILFGKNKNKKLTTQNGFRLKSPRFFPCASEKKTVENLTCVGAGGFTEIKSDTASDNLCVIQIFIGKIPHNSVAVPKSVLPNKTITNIWGNESTRHRVRYEASATQRQKVIKGNIVQPGEGWSIRFWELVILILYTTAAFFELLNWPSCASLDWPLSCTSHQTDSNGSINHVESNMRPFLFPCSRTV